MPSFADRVGGWRTALEGLERWLLPGACLLCDAPVGERDADALVCGLCRSRWSPVAGPGCERCGQPRLADVECRICGAWPVEPHRVRSAVWLDGPARTAVHRLKYDGWWRVADAIAIPMLALEPLTGQVSLIPIPLGARRQRVRGYNQSERIAAAIGRARDLPVRTDLLRRRRETPTQTSLTPEERQANLAGAFVAEDVSGLELVLVDDVFTTGATLVAAAAALAAGGAQRVDAITFARAREPVS
jgi:ComF family protein